MQLTKVLAIGAIVFSSAGAAWAQAEALDIHASVQSIVDMRGRGDAGPSGLSMKLRLSGDDVMATRGVEIVVKNAVDDTGRPVLFPDKFAGEPQKALDKVFCTQSIQQSDIDLCFKNPARKASTIKEISGDLRVYMPEKDPDAMAVFKDFRQTKGQPLSSPALEKAGVILYVFCKTTGNVPVEKRKKTRNDDSAQVEGEDRAEQGFEESLEKMSASASSMKANEITFVIKDPNHALLGLEITDANGSRIYSDSPSYWSAEMTMRLDRPIPADARLRACLKTEKSMVATPFELKDIPLP